MKNDEFVKANLPLVHSLANRFRGRGIEYEELYSAGCVGLVKACANFDESRGLCFSTYAVPVILGEIKRLFRDCGSVKISRSIKELSLRINKVREELSKDGREPTISELANKLGVDESDVAEAISASLPTVSLTCDEDGSELSLPAESCENSLLDRLALEQCISSLEKDDRRLIVLRYFCGKSQTETARLLGVSQVGVSRRERKILEEMRKQLT
ncbi:MAG: sigma-70 family RNA polymerase sigma factor [Oscillospiraceae bacterium]|nr:sigma-70 family RNA polymerase sigma factor [Oscillospiraceae bacterium]